MKAYSRKQKTSGSKAQAIVEFAIVLPILMMILVGIFEVGRMIYTYAAVNNASREAARFGSALGYDDLGNHKYKDCASIKAAATKSAYFIPLNITISYDTGPGGSSRGTCTAPSGEDASVPVLASGDRVQVSVTAHYRPLINLVPLPERDFTSISARTVLGSIEVASSSGGGGGGGGGGSTATATSAATATATLTATATVAPTLTPTATFSGPFATLTPVTPSSLPSTVTPVATATVPATATAGPTNTPADTPTAIATSTATTTVVATATTACTAPSVTLIANADAWIDQSSISTNHGSDTLLSVQSRFNTRNNRVLVGFSLPSVPTGCKINTATLSLYASSQTSGRTLQALQVSSSWTETGVNWTNQPLTTGAAVTTTSGSGYVSWTITSMVQAMSTGTNYGFLIRDASEDASGSGAQQQFISRENSSTNKPQLVITYTQAP